MKLHRVCYDVNHRGGKWWWEIDGVISWRFMYILLDLDHVQQEANDWILATFARKSSLYRRREVETCAA
jgi:hypothetical protein